MLIVGDEEEKRETFPIRAHGGEDLGKMNIEDFIQFIIEKNI